MTRLQQIVVCVCIIAVFATPAHAQSDAHVNAIMASMTLEQKVGQMFLVGLFGPNITDDGRHFLQTYQPGGVVLFKYNMGNAESITQLVNDWQSAITQAGAPPLIIGVDQEGGRINTLEFEPFTQFPVPILVTATGNHNLAYRYGAVHSQELRAIGIHMNLAPVADLETNPDNPVIFRRSYGSDPYTVAPILSATVQGMQDEGVMATLKHFPGHGDTNEDSHITLPVLPYELSALEQLELIPFRAGVDAGAEVVMVGHLALPAVDPTNRPASLSPVVITNLLRNDIGFGGIVMTDALDMDAIDTNYSLPNAAVMAVDAGVDFITPGPHAGMRSIENAIGAIIEAVEEGEISESRIDASVRRILSAKQRYNVLDWQPLDPATAEDRIRAVGGMRVVDELFAAGVTLVYDNDGLLPLDERESVLVAYPHERLTVHRACTTANPNAQTYGYNDYPTAENITFLTRAAESVDTIVVFTQNAINKPEQAALINSLPATKTVVVAYWSPYDINAFHRPPAAYLTAYSPHDAGLTTACNILFGTTPARGRLPVNLTETLLAATGASAPTRWE